MAFRTGARTTVASLALSLIVAGDAFAGERLVMPYVCTSLGGAVELDPSEPRSYAVIGPRDEQMVTSCSPADPNRCKTWRVYRFDIDCGGARVPWTSVVAAASEMSGGPAFTRQGRLYVQMGPWWGPRAMRPWGPPGRWTDDPTYGFDRPRVFDQWQRTRFARGGAVEMPSGFAPAIGIAARFVGSPDVGSAGEGGQDDFGMAATAPPPPVRATAPLPVPKPSRDDAAKPPEPKPAATAKQEKPALLPPVKPEQKVVAAAEIKPDSKTETKSEPAKPSSETSGATPPLSTSSIEKAGTSQAPRILNRPSGETTAQPSEGQTAATASQGAKEKAGVKSETVVADAKSTATGIPVDISDSRSSAGGVLASPSLQVLLSVAAVVLTTMTIFAWMRRGEPARGPRDLGTVTLGGSERKPQSSTPTSKALTLAGRLSTVSGDNGPELPDGSPDAKASALEASATDWLPKTRDEALQVLGAAPDASFEALKKIADGLRQSWHPDHARNDVDRAVRERRMKQINVAWDLVQRAA